MSAAIPPTRPYAFMPCTGTILCLHFINRSQTSRFDRKLRKFGLSTFLNRFIVELWNHSYIHALNVDVDSKTGAIKICAVVAKTVDA